jgi:hypothetical protein
MRVRIAGLHVSDKKPKVGDEVVLRGYTQIYDEKKKMWLPTRAKLRFVIDGMNYGTIYSDPNGLFEFRFSSNVKGKRKVEVIMEEVCKREMEVEFVSEEEKKKIERIGALAVLILILTLILLYLVMVIV